MLGPLDRQTSGPVDGRRFAASKRRAENYLRFSATRLKFARRNQVPLRPSAQRASASSPSNLPSDRPAADNAPESFFFEIFSQSASVKLGAEIIVAYRVEEPVGRFGPRFCVIHRQIWPALAIHRRLRSSGANKVHATLVVQGDSYDRLKLSTRQ